MQECSGKVKRNFCYNEYASFRALTASMEMGSNLLIWVRDYPKKKKKTAEKWHNSGLKETLNQIKEVATTSGCFKQHALAAILHRMDLLLVNKVKK